MGRSKASLVATAWAGLALALAVAAPAQSAAPLTPAEREVIAAGLGGCGEPSVVVDRLDDDTVLRALADHARVVLGQRVRPSRVDPLWAIEPPVRDVAAEIDKARADGTLGAWIQGLAPAHAPHRALEAACRRYEALAAAGGWEGLGEGPVLREGDVGPQISALRLRLAREGFALATAEAPERFGPDLTGSVKAFQQRRGLDADGVVGPRTRIALNVPVERRLAQILANLERWRWLPRRLPDDRIDVDTGGAEARLVAGGEVKLAMKAVVGDPKHKTPMFASRVDTVVFNPPWVVPPSIAAAEILPKAARDPGYLARNDFHYVDGRLEQRPGPKSALGVLKFDLPSPFGVYLHDTPAKGGFARADRHLSHGCMRLEKPRELAAALLSSQGGSRAGVDAAIAAGRTSRTALSAKLPLYVMYWSAVVDEAGDLILRPDPYGWDDELNTALAAAPRPQAAAAATNSICLRRGGRTTMAALGRRGRRSREHP